LECGRLSGHVRQRLLIFGWAGRTSDHAQMMPLGTTEQVRSKLREWIGDEPPFPLNQ
jgi:hypothetical protein